MFTEWPELSRLDYLEPIFAETGLALETRPEEWARLWAVPALRAIAYIDVPARFNPYPFSTAGLDYDACPYSLHLALIEYLSRFDASCLMALPGSSLCTRVVLTLGTPAQMETVFQRFSLGTEPHWAFFAVTELEVGSDASQVRSHLSGSGTEKRLNAEKMLIGSAQQASIGLVFARDENTQGLCLVMIEPMREPHKITCERLPVFGLAGAGLARLVIRDLPITADQVIGGERRSLRDGLILLLRVFERHRPMVGAMALGAARGLVTALERSGVPADTLAMYKLEHAALYRLMMRVARNYEQSRPSGTEASLFKVQATRFAERVARSVPTRVPSKALMASPVLRKKYRDVFAFEYMEGTSNMQLLNAYRHFVASRANHDAAS
jgi:alkylation response protein AidB-like acyl-CoA dehydrogenase